ncbi:aldehyde dehydrogenase family protein [Nocardia puris]|uniref:Acyl-CoA reductase-like NAD-dependent aldehyde dehydrogenase n=1 Tax=Nocardia puris TaxID=208602 RepID=A0A366DHJ4_9NOCA|nr:aldehyde dehydrogenase family protein [Nocardia puris]RBO88989.1 acyl-CoA reductase-like NAD-dependent aldehyde dehydrogenase [Nocardia puris]
MAESAQPRLAAHPGGSSRSTVLTSYDPRTGEAVGTYPVLGASELHRTARAARAAEKWWAELGFGGRKRWLLDWKRDIARRADELVELLCAETGKPEADAAIEVALAVENLDWAARNAARALRRRKLGSTWLARNQHAAVGQLPLGTVGVIGPWNNPVFTPMASIAYAMAAGNAVVFKPHELTTGVGVWLAETWSALAPNQPVLQVVTGDSGTVAALCRAKLDKIAYAGSETGAREVISLCAPAMTPVVVERGGKGAMVVHVDAKLDEAAEAAVFGAMANAGQNAHGVQRAYVADSVYDAFLDLVADQARRLRPGADKRASYGPMVLESQIEVVRKQVRDALGRGGRAVVGGLESIRDPYIEPIVLADVPEESLAVTGEAFGPVLVVNRVADMDDAAKRINTAGNGVAVSVFTRDVHGVELFAEQLRVGVVTINSSTAHLAIPALPIGGVGEYGHGHSHGDQGLREFSRTLAVARKRYRAATNLATFERHPRQLRLAKAMFRLRHGRAI